MNKILTALVLSIALPAVAHGQAAPAPAPKHDCCEKMKDMPCCKDKAKADCCKDMDHSKMDHSKMDHSKMDHSGHDSATPGTEAHGGHQH